MKSNVSYKMQAFVLIVLWSFLPHKIHTKCTLRVDDDLIRKNFTHFVTTNSTKHLTVMLEFGNNKPNSANWSTYEPERWDIPTSDFGLSTLTSHPDITFFSLGFFKLGTDLLRVNITAEPTNCIRNLTEEEFVISVFNLFSSGLNSSESRNRTVNVKDLKGDDLIRFVYEYQQKFLYTPQNTKVLEKRNFSVLPNDTLVCRELVNKGSYGKIVHFDKVCCNVNFVCSKLEPGWWQKVLFHSIMLLGIIVFLHVTSFIPEYVYKDRYGYRIFYHELPTSSKFRVVETTSDNMAANADPEADACVSFTHNTKSMKSLFNLQKGGTYLVKGLWLKAPDIRLVSNSYLPIGLFIFLYQRLLRCTCYTYRGHTDRSNPKPRKTTAARDSIDVKSSRQTNRDFTIRICCDLPICNPNNKLSYVPSWKTVLQLLMAVLSSAMFAIPWFLIYIFDDHLLEGRRGSYVSKKGLIYDEPIYAFNILRFVKFHIPQLSIAIIALYTLCIVTICIIVKYDRLESAFVGKRLRSTLRNAKTKWSNALFKPSNLYVLLFLPFKVLRNYGLFALLLWPFWLLIACPFIILVLIVGNTPTVKIFIRLLKLFIKEVANIFRSSSLRTNSKQSVKRLVLCLAFICVLIIVQFLIYAMTSLIVNVIAYTLAGIIVTAKETYEYTTFALLILVNAYDCFNSVDKKYIVFHERVQAALLKRTHEDFKKAVAKHKTNIAFSVSTEIGNSFGQTNDLLWESITMSEKNHLLYNARSVVQFLDKGSEVYLSEKFFFDSCYMNYEHCPGDFVSNLLDAFRRVLIIVMFLIFVLFTLNSFGGISGYSVSGLLLTLTGLLPVLINRFFSKPVPELKLDTDDFKFKNMLDELIHNFCEYWEVVDIDLKKIDSLEGESGDMKRSAFWLCVGDQNIIQLSVPIADDSGKDISVNTENNSFIGEEHGDSDIESVEDDDRTDMVEMKILDHGVRGKPGKLILIRLEFAYCFEYCFTHSYFRQIL